MGKWHASLPDCEMPCSRLTDRLLPTRRRKAGVNRDLSAVFKCRESPSDQRSHANSGPTRGTSSNVPDGADTLVCSAGPAIPRCHARGGSGFLAPVL
jgi:hypothetical protein